MDSIIRAIAAPTLLALAGWGWTSVLTPMPIWIPVIAATVGTVGTIIIIVLGFERRGVSPDGDMLFLWEVACMMAKVEPTENPTGSAAIYLARIKRHIVISDANAPLRGRGSFNLSESFIAQRISEKSSNEQISAVDAQKMAREWGSSLYGTYVSGNHASRSHNPID